MNSTFDLESSLRFDIEIGGSEIRSGYYKVERVIVVLVEAERRSRIDTFRESFDTAANASGLLLPLS